MKLKWIRCVGAGTAVAMVGACSTLPPMKVVQTRSGGNVVPKAEVKTEAKVSTKDAVATTAQGQSKPQSSPPTFKTDRVNSLPISPSAPLAGKSRIEPKVDETKAEVTAAQSEPTIQSSASVTSEPIKSKSSDVTQSPGMSSVERFLFSGVSALKSLLPPVSKDEVKPKQDLVVEGEITVAASNSKEAPVGAAELPVAQATISEKAETEVPVAAPEVPVAVTEVPVAVTEVPVAVTEVPVAATEVPVAAIEAQSNTSSKKGFFESKIDAVKDLFKRDSKPDAVAKVTDAVQVVDQTPNPEGVGTNVTEKIDIQPVDSDIQAVAKVEQAKVEQGIPKQKEVPIVADKGSIAEPKETRSVESPKVAKASPKGSVKKKNSTGFVDLAQTLLERKKTRQERIGPTDPAPKDEGFQTKSALQAEVLDDNPPQIKEYTLDENQKAEISASADQLLATFELAKVNDPAYQSALFEYRAGLISADLSALAFSPSVSLNNRFLENEASSRTTISIVQPLFSLDALATLKEEDSKRALAEAKLRTREYELVEKVFKSVIELIKAQEKLAVNKARIEALSSASLGASREFELGQGTITDVRDAAVRLEQVRAEQIRLESSLISATRTLAQLTGKAPDLKNFLLRKSDRTLKLDPLAEYKAQAYKFNSNLLTARASERLAELAAVKSKAAFLPSINLSANRSYSQIGDTSTSGLVFGLNVPVNAGTFFQSEIASARISQAQLSTRDVQLKLDIEVEQTFADINSGLNEVNIRLRAIDAAELSLKATERSFKGGVRTRLDVLNTVQTVFAVNEQYINSVTELAGNFLKLRNLTAQQPSQTVQILQKLLF